MDLDKANATPEETPTWQHLFDYKEAYDMPDLSPNSLQLTANRIKTDIEMTSFYEWNMHGQYGEKPQLNQKEQLKTYCSVDSSEFYEYVECVKSKGTSKSSYGRMPSFFSAEGIIDRFLLPSWIEIEQD